MSPPEDHEGWTERCEATAAGLSMQSHPAEAELDKKEPRKRSLPCPGPAALTEGSQGLRTCSDTRAADSQQRLYS